MPDREKIISEFEKWIDDPLAQNAEIEPQLVHDALELLKEQEAVVRCGDCRHGHLVGSGFFECKKNIKAHYADWFCADGERKEGR